ncbi:MAG: caspase family protein, partial [Bacteroidota bacterium]
MQTTFTHGYALLIGVHQQAHAGVSSLPGVANDISSLYRILTDPNRCAYPPENVSLLQGEAATKANILAELRD